MFGKWQYFRKSNFSFAVLIFFFCRAHFSAADPQWKTYRYEPFHFTIESPFPLTATDHPLTPVLPGKNKIVRRMLADSLRGSRGFRMTVDCQVYESYKPSLGKIKKHLLAETENSQVPLKIDEVLCSGTPALLVKGDSEAVHARTLVIAKGRFFWILKIEYAEKNPGAIAATADRVIRSMTLMDGD